MAHFPGTDEDVVAELATGWAGARDALSTAATGVEDAGKLSLASWPDQVGQDFAGRVQERGRLHALASGMGTASARATRFENTVRATKTSFVNEIAAKAPLYGVMGLLPEPLRSQWQGYLVVQVANNLNGVLSANAGEMAGGPGPEDEGGFFEELAEGAGDLARLPYEAGRAVEEFIEGAEEEAYDALDEAGLTPGWLDDLVEEGTELKDGLDDLRDGVLGDGGLVDDGFAWVGRQIDGMVGGNVPNPHPEVQLVPVDDADITPAPFWRTSDEPLWRSDPRLPDDVFATGFPPKDPSNLDVELHANYKVDSAFVSTTSNPNLYRAWVKPAYWYTLEVPGGVQVNLTLDEPFYRPEKEIAFPGGIKPEYIVGARPVNADGTLGDWIENPNFVPHR